MKPIRHSLSALRSTQGFTLIELLVVIAIIGILAAILIPSYAASQRRPYDVAAQQCAKAIAAGQITYRSEHTNNSGKTSDLGADVAEQCTNVQVSQNQPNSVSDSGDGTISFVPNAYAFFAWSQNGTGIYYTRKDTNGMTDLIRRVN